MQHVTDYVEARSHVDSMIQARTPLSQIAERVKTMSISEEAQAALWLLAFCASSPPYGIADPIPAG